MDKNESAECLCCGQKTLRSEEEKKKLLNRLSRLEGQIRGIRKMVENDAYCNDILTQSAAASAAVDAFSRAVLRAHLHSCVVQDIRAGRDEVVDELTETLERLMR